MMQLKKCIELSISQIPVFDSTVVVGVVSEDGIVKHLADRGEAELKKSKLSDTMDIHSTNCRF